MGDHARRLRLIKKTTKKPKSEREYQKIGTGLEELVKKETGAGRGG